MRILCNLTIGPGNTTNFALSVGEDEDGTICVAMIGELAATAIAPSGDRWVIQSGYWAISNPNDAEEVAECAKWLQTHYNRLQVGETVPTDFSDLLTRIADVLCALDTEVRA